MSDALRIILLFAALATAGWILYKIRKLKVKMEDAIFWIIFAGILCVMGVFPQVTYWLTYKIGIMSPANLIFLVVIFLLVEKIFTLSIIVSQLEEKVTVLSAELALRSHAAEKRLDEVGGNLMHPVENCKQMKDAAENDTIRNALANKINRMTGNETEI